MQKTKQNKIYLIGNAHIDPVWLWLWQEGLSEIKATFRSALDRISEYDDFIFVCSGASYYKWVEDSCPEMFEEIVSRVKEGRWQVVGGWWTQPDCNLPDGESFVRHGLYSQRYFHDKFGITCETGYNVDSFGHNHTLPQILTKSGMKNYVFMRPSVTEANLPSPLFLWESPDGSRVLAFRILDDHYNNCFRTLEETISGTAEKSNMNTDNVMLFFGVGNHGGGPTIKALEIIKKKQKELGKDNLFISGPNQYFSDMRKEHTAPQVFTGDLQYFGSGCYATCFEFKKAHRNLEQLLLAAERWNTLAQNIMGYRDESCRIKAAWETLMFNQFHDIMGGCSLQDAMHDAEGSLSYSGHIASDVLNGTLQRLSWAVNTQKPAARRSKEKSGRVWDYDGAGAPLIVFNPLPFPAQMPVFLDLVPEDISSHDGKDVPMQAAAGRYMMKGKNPGAVFMADLPGLGYSTYWLHMPDKPPEEADEKKPKQRLFLENEKTRLAIDDKTGLIKSLYNKTKGFEIIDKLSAQPLVVDESEADTWGNGFETFDKVIGEFALASVRLIEDGPVRSVIRAEFSYERSSLRQDYILYAGSSDIDVDLRVNWQEKHKILKLAFDAKVKYPLATYSCAYGHITKPCNGKEEPGQMWMDISGTSDGKLRGLALACQARYSYSTQKNSMRLNVVRSPMFAEYNSKDGRSESVEHMDQGIHKLSYKLVPHDGQWQSSGIIQKALCLNNPAQKVHETYHDGPLPLKMETVHVTNPQIILSVIKKPEDSEKEGIVVRLYEALGRQGETQLKIVPFGIDISLSFGAFEIKTILIKPDGSFEEMLMTELDA